MVLYDSEDYPKACLSPLRARLISSSSYLALNFLQLNINQKYQRRRVSEREREMEQGNVNLRGGLGGPETGPRSVRPTPAKKMKKKLVKTMMAEFVVRSFASFVKKMKNKRLIHPVDAAPA
ncbi:hypothetical protein F0562_002802 [Nyssa sinensis]|uniref:Uncharacterized protein n=1 Tax=Nyssa sinensis TaxID=561372 RepID=A0A5J5BU16_9ASTE|nr:hypothetical protein F0562_002802 [Nyssa sinensis]